MRFGRWTLQNWAPACIHQLPKWCRGRWGLGPADRVIADIERCFSDCFRKVEKVPGTCPGRTPSNLHSQRIVAARARLAEPLDQRSPRIQSERVDELGQSLAVGEVGKGFRKTSVEVSVPFWHLGYFQFFHCTRMAGPKHDASAVRWSAKATWLYIG